MTYEHILAEREDGVGILTLNRPDVLNAMSRKLGAELLDAVKMLDADDAIGCLVITGACDKAFSAGGDIKEQVEDDKGYTRDEQDRMGNPRRALEISMCSKSVIGMMNGLAYGAAAVLASSLDIRFRFLAAGYQRINATWSLGS
jgi:enoyl-CoA hydratase/carnithine racemase